MFVSVRHVIHDAEAFQDRGRELLASVPEGIQAHQFYPAKDLSRAVCLWEGPDVDAVRNFIDGALGDASTQEYFPVAEEQANGLPAGKAG